MHLHVMVHNQLSTGKTIPLLYFTSPFEFYHQLTEKMTNENMCSKHLVTADGIELQCNIFDKKCVELTSENQWTQPFPLHFCFFFQIDMKILDLHHILVYQYHTSSENLLETVPEVHFSVPQLKDN